jgi:hypothetical protein
VHSESELEDAAAGITYRIDQVVGGIHAMRPGQYRAVDEATAQVIANDLIEATLTFSRVLTYFLNERDTGYVVAAAYLDGWDKRTVSLDKATLIGAVSDHVAHARFVEKRSWPLIDIARELVDAFTVFVRALAASPHADRADWFRETVDRADRALAALGTPSRLDGTGTG